MEIWKIVDKYPKYEVSSLGRVMHIKKDSPVGPYKNSKGYSRVSITIKPNLKKKVQTHRLVAEAFIPNPKNLPIVDHINGKKDDNRIENLRWVSQTENSRNRHMNLDKILKIINLHKSGLSAEEIQVSLNRYYYTL